MVRTFLMNASDLNDDALYYKYYGRLSEERRRKADAFYFRKEKNLCVGAGILLDFGLAQIESFRNERFGGFLPERPGDFCCDFLRLDALPRLTVDEVHRLCEKEIKIAEDSNGKPCFPDYPELFFNISHSEEYVAVAFSDCEVGIDIEKVTDIDLDIARKYFFRSEFAAIENRTDPLLRSDCFFRLWTLKESFMKATGLGMSLPLNRFEIVLEESVRVKQTINNKKYGFIEINGDRGVQGYKIAVCTAL